MPPARRSSDQLQVFFSGFYEESDLELYFHHQWQKIVKTRTSHSYMTNNRVVFHNIRKASGQTLNQSSGHLVMKHKPASCVTVNSHCIYSHYLHLLYLTYMDAR